MKKISCIALLAALLLGFELPFAHAQTVGVRGGFDLNVEDAFVGAEARFDVPGIDLPVTLNPTLDYFLVNSDVDDVLDEIDVEQRLVVGSINALYAFGVGNPYFSPYLGAGLNVMNSAAEAQSGDETISSSSTDFGLNLVGGTTFGSGMFQPYAQARLTTFTSRELFSLTGGVLVRLGM